jgi:MYXO-CTERM domain-containing protein
MIGPFSQTDVFMITSTGPIEQVMLEVSGAATTIPAPGGTALAAIAAAALARRRR